MPGLNGLDLQHALAASRAQRHIVFITGQGDIPTSVRAMKAGTVNFLVKPFNDSNLLAAVSEAIEKDRLARQSRAELHSIEERLTRLTPREREVLEHVTTGRLNKQIAADLGTVEKTVKVHRARVMEKMGADSLATLVRMAERLGIKSLSQKVIECINEDCKKAKRPQGLSHPRRSLGRDQTAPAKARHPSPAGVPPKAQ
jgi:FixJ family two-component response regulator